MYFLVDYENVKNDGLRGVEFLTDQDTLILFYSKAAYHCEKRYLKKITESGCNVEICKLVQTGKNALDFYIATKVGEIFGSGEKGPLVIISKDGGFQAVRDYWEKVSNSKNRVHLSPNIEKGIVSGGENNSRFQNVKASLENADIGEFFSSYVKGQEFQDAVEKVLFGSSYKNDTPAVLKLLKEENSDNKMAIYMALIQKFGQKKGLKIYHIIKPVLQKKN